MQIFSNANFNFIRWRWHALALSTLVIVAGLAVIISRGGMPLGIDFSGGTIVIVKFDQPVSETQVRGAVDPIAGEEVVQQYGDAADNQWLIRLAQSQAAERRTCFSSSVSFSKSAKSRTSCTSFGNHVFATAWLYRSYAHW